MQRDSSLISVQDYLQGKVKIDEYVTHHRKFEEINDGFHDMHVSSLHPLCLDNPNRVSQAGDCIRCVVDMA